MVIACGVPGVWMEGALQGLLPHRCRVDGSGPRRGVYGGVKTRQSAVRNARRRSTPRRETAAKQAMQAETRLFAEHMLKQKREADMQEKLQEEIRAKELDKAWDKRLTVWDQEQEARERLMAQVLDERRLQVMTKLESEQFEKKKSAADRRTLEVELDRVNRMEGAKVQAAAQTRMDHRALLEELADLMAEQPVFELGRIAPRPAPAVKYVSPSPSPSPSPSSSSSPWAGTV